MKKSTLMTIFLLSFFTITACNLVTQTMAPTSIAIQEVTTPTLILDGEAIRSALAAHLGANAHDLKVVITQNTGTYAKGSVENGYFLAVKVDGEWLIVADGQAMPDCELVAQYDFPPAMVPECSTAKPPSDEEAIRAALAAHLGANADDLRIVVTQNTGTHAKGSVEKGYFLAVKVDGEWRIVADGQAMPDCQLVEQYEFPPIMVPECQTMDVNDVLKFKTGGTYTFVKNLISAGERQTYRLKAMANQTMIVSVASDQKDVFVGIKGLQGGQQLLSPNDLTGYWRGKLPQTQDYALTQYPGWSWSV